MERTITLHELADELPRVLEFARVDRDVHVIVSCGVPYVQFAFPEGWILAEAVSNEYLEDDDRLSEHDEAVLDILGWQRPGVDRDEHDHRNFFREWHNDTPSADIAETVLRTFTGVYLREESDVVDLNVFLCDWCETHQTERAFGDDGSSEDEDRRWTCVRCGVVNLEDASLCVSCGLGKEASVWPV